jgi:hypothetical protein
MGGRDGAIEGAAADVQAEALVPMDGAADVATASPDAASDVVQEAVVPSDATTTDATTTTDAVTTDATAADAPEGDAALDAVAESSSDGAVADASDAGLCPGSQPAENSTCTQNASCNYGSTQCACHVVSANTRKWSCLGPDAGPAPTCPNQKPSDGASCSDAGASYFCRFGNTFCFCNQVGGPADQWTCF